MDRGSWSMSVQILNSVGGGTNRVGTLLFLGSFAVIFMCENLEQHHSGSCLMVTAL